MKATILLACTAIAISACDSRTQEERGEFNDIVTATRLGDAQPLGAGGGADRATRLAQCAGLLVAAGAQTPPPPRLDAVIAQAERLRTVAILVGTRNGQQPADIDTIRDEAVASINQFARTEPEQYASLAPAATERCLAAENLSNDQLTQ